MNAKERPVWTHDPGALLAASVGGRYAGSAMTIRNDTAAGAGTQAIRWCVSHLEAETVEGLCRTAGYCHIVDATVTWGDPAMDEARAFVEAVPWLFQADVPCAFHRCIAEGCEAVVDYRLEFCDWHAEQAVTP